MNASSDMERAARLLARIKLAPDLLPAEKLAIGAWPEAVGPRIARRTCPVALLSGCLVVEVEDDLWRRQLSTLKPHILEKLQQILGLEIVADIEFRLPRRRGPRVAEKPHSDHCFDEADRIADPILRQLYRRDRSRRSA